MWSKVIGRHRTLTLTDIEGGANVGMLLYNANERLERYNMPDTLKGQHRFYLTSPYCVHSDMGRLLCSIVEDTAGWHDTVCGSTNASTVLSKYGKQSYQDAGNEFFRNGYECFVIELAKWGLGKRDLTPNINFFSKITADEQGELHFVKGASRAGAFVKLRFEMDTLVILNTCQHPLDPNSDYAPKAVHLSVSASAAPGLDDPCRTSRPENERAFRNTEDYHSLRG